MLLTVEALYCHLGDRGIQMITLSKNIRTAKGNVGTRSFVGFPRISAPLAICRSSPLNRGGTQCLSN